jgi:predicted Zn-dependent protease
MPKPRVFIGSSVEGLNVAYPVQQNLSHEAEVTIWDQGVFELSSTTMESLTKVLSDSDFAVFVFSPDDLVRIRSQTAPTVRDNVLFEFGLFIGKLGRDRVFFILPSNGELHIPTDLLGVTPGRYDVSRTDGSMQAATGPVCHQIRLQMKRLGIVPGRIIVEVSTEGSVADDLGERDWISDFFDEKYQQAKTTLQREMQNQSGEKELESKAWILFCDLKLRGDGNIDELIKYSVDHQEFSGVQAVVASALRFQGHAKKAIELLSIVQRSRPNDTEIAMSLARCHLDEADTASAIEKLQHVGPDDFPEVAILLAETYEKDENTTEALVAIQRCYAKNPSHQKLKFKYARLAQELDQNYIAAYLLNRLTIEDPKSVDYWGYLGNSCIQLDLYDSALKSYRKAQNLMAPEDNSQWIGANIGNLFINKGLPTEACEYLERAVKLESQSDYSHDRLASALKKKNSEAKEFQNKCDEGRRQVSKAMEAIVTLPQT